MRKLDDHPVAELQMSLESADSAKAVKRLTVALAYKNGVSVDVLSERYGYPESTIYYWLDRLDGSSLAEAITDDPRPGRPSELSPDQRATVREWVRTTPRGYGLDADEWSPERLRDRIADEFGVDYSLGHVRRLLRE